MYKGEGVTLSLERSRGNVYNRLLREVSALLGQKRFDISQIFYAKSIKYRMLIFGMLTKRSLLNIKIFFIV